MDRQLAAKMHRFGVANLRNSGLLRAIRALNRYILINNLFGPDLFKNSPGDRDIGSSLIGPDSATSVNEILN